MKICNLMLNTGYSVIYTYFLNAQFHIRKKKLFLNSLFLKMFVISITKPLEFKSL